MGKFNGKAVIPGRFLFKHILPSVFEDIHRLNLLRFPYRRYVKKYDTGRKFPVSQISMRVNEACNLRCGSCGQWGENGHLRLKQERGEKLQQLSLDTAKRIILETRRDKPVYYIWGGEPTLWKPLLPFFEELGRNKLYGSIVTNGQNIEPILEDLIDTGALNILFLSLDGWDSRSQNTLRSPASGKSSRNFEKIMSVIDTVDEIKKRKGVKMPFVVPITVISNHNYAHLADIHELVKDKTQLHPYYYGWYITEERARDHEKDFQDRFGFLPENHKGYLKSCFNDVDHDVVAEQVEKLRTEYKDAESVPQFLPDIYSRKDIKRYYTDHAWTAGYNFCESIYHVAEISPNGTVTPCRDYQDYVAGNVNEQSFYEIWNGEKFNTFREEMKKGLMPVCSRCCGLQGF
ncbi:MAG: SPASM domain-containing protein [Fibrobacterota bacterium]